MNRIQFFSINDGTVGYFLLKLEDRYSELEMIEDLEINDLLELYNAKLYIDNELFLIKWDEKKKKQIKNKTADNWEKIKCFFLNIKSESLPLLFGQVDYKYKSCFWMIVEQLGVYKKINNESIETILNSYPREIRNLLERKRIVTKFSSVIKHHLLSNSDSAELLLSEEDNTKGKNKLHFPKSLTNCDKEKIINNYLDQDSPNLNYVSLILYAKDSSLLRLSDKTRLKAKRTYERLSDAFLNSNDILIQKHAIEVGTVRKQNTFVVNKWEGNTYKVTYDIDEFMSLLEKSNLNLLFISLFQFLDREGLINLVSKDSEASTMENIFMRSRNEYGSSQEFHRKDFISIAQIDLTMKLLHDNSKDISLLVYNHLTELSCYNEVLKNIRFKMPSGTLSHEESIRVLAPSLESLLNQYALFVNEGEIDFELLEISSKPISFSGIKSNAPKKYIYPKLNSKITRYFNLFFSDQSILHYVKPYNEKYNNFYDLLINEENIPFSNFESYQKDSLNQLVDDELLLIENGEFIKIINENQLFMVAQLYSNDVVSYWHYPPTFRNELDKLVEQGFCYTESTLFTKHEVTYINFYLNKKEYTDGPDLRNKYLHGTNLSSDMNSVNDYYMYLRVLILCLLKIEDDLLITEECKKYDT